MNCKGHALHIPQLHEHVHPIVVLMLWLSVQAERELTYINL